MNFKEFWKKKTADNAGWIEYLRTKGIRIGKDCEIYKDVSWGSEPYLISIGDHVRITSGCRFITHDGGVWVLRKMYGIESADLFGPIKVGNNVHIGMNSVIMPGVTVGNNVIIGCGAVVTHDIPDGEVWGGVPARKIKTIEEYYEKNKDRFEATKGLSSEEKRNYLKEKFGSLQEEE
jgi:acetyltransferase-like isoleucine patch superfamily enzyme